MHPTVAPAHSVVDANRAHVVNVFGGLRRFLSKERWLARDNYYLRDTISKTDGLPIRDGQLVEYVAASGPLHAADSARYLARALFCHWVNDSYSARHFAYYAELRAAMALLATEGIGVFNRRHYLVTGQRSTRQITGIATHRFAWQALSEWATLPRAANLIGRIVAPEARPLGSYLDAAFPGMTLLPIVSDWFTTWGIDLKVLATDQHRRNEASYRPTTFGRAPKPTTKSALKMLANFWLAFNPTLTQTFSIIDRHLLRLALEQQIAALPMLGSVPNAASRMVATVPLSPIAAAALEAFLLRRGRGNRHDLDILSRAAKPISRTRPARDLHFQMICRAALLLRIALGAVTALISDSGVTDANTEFWITQFGGNAGLYLAGAVSFPEPSELWDSIEDAILQINRIIGAPETPTLPGLIDADSARLLTLSQAERIACWALTTKL
jgi:hypothetical protein